MSKRQREREKEREKESTIKITLKIYRNIKALTIETYKAIQGLLYQFLKKLHVPD